MSQVTLANPIMMKTALLTLGADNYELVVSAAELAPTTPKTKFKGIGGNSLNITGTPDWVFNVSFPQDLASAKSLTNFCNTNVGVPTDAVLTPVAGGPSYKFNFTPEAVNIGGTVDTMAVSTASFDVNGTPTVQTAG